MEYIDHSGTWLEEPTAHDQTNGVAEGGYHGSEEAATVSDAVESAHAEAAPAKAALSPTERRLAAAKALLAELEEKAVQEAREKRVRARKAEVARDKRLAVTRGAALKQLYTSKGIESIPGDRFEKERFAALLKALEVSS